MHIPTIRNDVPYLDTEQMIEVDRAMVEDYHIKLIQMMESAGHCLAILARERFLESRPEGKYVTVMAGSGGNGGGALVAARRLHNWGAKVQVLHAQAATRMTPVPRHQLDILERMGVECVPEPEIPQLGRTPQLILDGLIGYSLKGAPYGVKRDLIEWSNASRTSVLALDTPSGLDTATGTVFDPSIIATATMTLALPKKGLRSPGVEAYVGELYLADIGVPPSLYNKPALGLEVGPIFATGDIVRLK
jgi:NAD(P)H-hydrate epimerase